MILEANLNDLVAKPEHDGMLSSHPLLYVYNLSWLSWIILCNFISHFGVAISVRRLTTSGSISTIRSIYVIVF